MTALGDRITAIIDALGIKKTNFADKINVSQAFVSQLCAGVKQPSDRTIIDICREFNVNRTWLETGGGEMFVKLSRKDEIANFMGGLLKAENTDFRHRLISVLARIEPEQWQMLERTVDMLIDELKKENEEPGH